MYCNPPCKFFDVKGILRSLKHGWRLLKWKGRNKKNHEGTMKAGEQREMRRRRISRPIFRIFHEDFMGKHRYCKPVVRQPPLPLPTTTFPPPMTREAGISFPCVLQECSTTIITPCHMENKTAFSPTDSLARPSTLDLLIHSSSVRGPLPVR